MTTKGVTGRSAVLAVSTIDTLVNLIILGLHVWLMIAHNKSRTWVNRDPSFLMNNFAFGIFLTISFSSSLILLYAVILKLVSKYLILVNFTMQTVVITKRFLFCSPLP